jgi:SAM-dependent methyltransferase
MGQQLPKGNFTDVDRATDPHFYVRHLDRQHASPFKQLYKGRTFALLDLRPGQRVLDVGCGTGQDALAMAANVGPTGQVAGVDVSQTMVDEARRRAQETHLPVSFLQGDAQRLEFPDDSFDRCRADRTFQHLPDPERALAEMIRVLKPGGLLLIVEPDHDSLVIDSPYKDVTRRFLAFRSDGLRQGDIAHRLFALFREFGLADVTVEAAANVSTDYETAITFQYDKVMRDAAECGVVTHEEAERWIATLAEAGRAGRFLSCGTTFITTGRKPT